MSTANVINECLNIALISDTLAKENPTKILKRISDNSLSVLFGNRIKFNKKEDRLCLSVNGTVLTLKDTDLFSIIGADAKDMLDDMANFKEVDYRPDNMAVTVRRYRESGDDTSSV